MCNRCAFVNSEATSIRRKVSSTGVVAAASRPAEGTNPRTVHTQSMSQL